MLPGSGLHVWLRPTVFWSAVIREYGRARKSFRCDCVFDEKQRRRLQVVGPGKTETTKFSLHCHLGEPEAEMGAEWVSKTFADLGEETARGYLTWVPAFGDRELRIESPNSFEAQLYLSATEHDAMWDRLTHRVQPSEILLVVNGPALAGGTLPDGVFWEVKKSEHLAITEYSFYYAH